MILDVLNKKLPGKKVFVTGAGSGLGASFTKLLAENDWELHLADINTAGLEEVKASLPNKDKVYLYELNIADRLNFEKVAGEVKAKTGVLDLVINNAGIGDGELIQHYDIDAWERMIQVNIIGVYYGVHFLLPLLWDNGGMIINVGSAAGFMNAPGMSAYNVSKAGVYSFSESIYHELKFRNIHVSVVTPTFFQTNIAKGAFGSPKFAAFAEKQMKYSKTNATEMAKVVLTQAAKGKFQIIHPTDARRNFFLKKWFPKLVQKQFDKMMAKFSS